MHRKDNSYSRNSQKYFQIVENKNFQKEKHKNLFKFVQNTFFKAQKKCSSKRSSIPSSMKCHNILFQELFSPENKTPPAISDDFRTMKIALSIGIYNVYDVAAKYSFNKCQLPTGFQNASPFRRRLVQSVLPESKRPRSSHTCEERDSARSSSFIIVPPHDSVKNTGWGNVESRTVSRIPFACLKKSICCMHKRNTLFQ